MQQKADTDKSDTATHLQGQHLSVCPAMVSSAWITAQVQHFKALSVSVCPPALSLADRSEVADQAGRLCVWCNSLPSRQAASCNLLWNFVPLPETLCFTPVARSSVPSPLRRRHRWLSSRDMATLHGCVYAPTYVGKHCVGQVHLECAQ